MGCVADVGFMAQDSASWPNDQAIATPLAGASIDRGVNVEVKWSIETEGLVGVAIRALVCAQHGHSPNGV